jgi:hypothetical protein
MERGSRAAIAKPRPLRRAALDRHLFARISRLRRENAARALLAFQAMADGNANGLAFTS